MDSSLFKDVTTTRGLKYHYYSSPAVDEKPTLLFLHGFPSTSYDWRHQVPFFKEKGYGLIVPDLLGYGGTDKPSDPASYKYSLMTADIVDILDAEKVDKVIPIGHDWLVVFIGLHCYLRNGNAQCNCFCRWFIKGKFLDFAFGVVLSGEIRRLWVPCSRIHAAFARLQYPWDACVHKTSCRI